jgi:hypothetical protein
VREGLFLRTPSATGIIDAATREGSNRSNFAVELYEELPFSGGEAVTPEKPGVRFRYFTK